MNNAPVGDPDDRAKPVVVADARRHDRSMHLVLDDDDMTLRGQVPDQVVCCMDDDVLAVAAEALHQVSLALDDSRPARKIVEDFVDYVVGGAIEEMFAVDEITHGSSHEVEIGLDRHEGRIL